MKTYTVEINYEKKNEHSFLVALVPAPAIPDCYEEDKEIMLSNCAVVAANHSHEGGTWAYVHLERGEKQAIGDALSDSCVKMGWWYWCNLYSAGEDELDELRTRLAEAEAKIGRWQGDMNAVLDQRNDYHANVVALRDALDIIQSGFEYRNGDPKMDGTFERFPHVLKRSRMMEIAREALAKLEEK